MDSLGKHPHCFWRVFEGNALYVRFPNPVVYHTRCCTASGKRCISPGKSPRQGPMRELGHLNPTKEQPQ